MTEHGILRGAFVVGALGSLSLVVALAAGVRVSVWVQLAAAFSLLSAFACLYWAEILVYRQELLVLELGNTVNELVEENHKARKAMAEFVLLGQLRTAFGGRPPHRTGPQSLLCPSCARADCPGIRGLDLCPIWREAEARNARGEYLPITPGPQLFIEQGGPAGLTFTGNTAEEPDDTNPGQEDTQP